MSPEAPAQGMPSGRGKTLDGAVGVWEWDIKSETLYADARFAELYGLDPAAARAGLATSAFFAAVDPEHRMRVRIAVAGALHGAEVFGRDFRIISTDGILDTTVSASVTSPSVGAP